MKHRALNAVTFVAFGFIGALLGVGDAKAVVSNADYSAVPPFVSSVTTPNILCCSITPAAWPIRPVTRATAESMRINPRPLWSRPT